MLVRGTEVAAGAAAGAVSTPGALCIVGRRRGWQAGIGWHTAPGPAVGTAGTSGGMAVAVAAVGLEDGDEAGERSRELGHSLREAMLPLPGSRWIAGAPAADLRLGEHVRWALGGLVQGVAAVVLAPLPGDSCPGTSAHRALDGRETVTKTKGSCYLSEFRGTRPMGASQRNGMTRSLSGGERQKAGASVSESESARTASS